MQGGRVQAAPGRVMVSAALPGQGLSLPKAGGGRAGTACSSPGLWSGEEGMARHGAGSQGTQRRAVECPSPRCPALGLLGMAARIQSLSGALKSCFQALPRTPHDHKLPALLYRQALLFPRSRLPLDQGWGMQCWHRPCAGMGMLAAPRWGVKCWCLQGGSFTSLVCTLQKSETKISGSPTRPQDTHG